MSDESSGLNDGEREELQALRGRFAIERRGAPRDVLDEAIRELNAMHSERERLYRRHASMTEAEMAEAHRKAAILDAKMDEHRRLKLNMARHVAEFPFDDVHPVFRDLRIELTHRNLELARRNAAESQSIVDEAERKVAEVERSVGATSK